MYAKIFVFLLTILSLRAACAGQSAQATNTALLRTVMIATNFGTGTAFSVDVDNREYWVTAKHMFTGIKTGPAGEFKTKTVQANILSISGDGDQGHDQHWTTDTFTTIDPGKDIDILVLAPSHLLLLNYPRTFNLKAGSATVGLGGDCEFLGFPYGGGWKANFQDQKDPNKNNWLWLPYVKHCTPSAQVRDNGLLIWVLDGINNEGFSGGPVLTGTGQNQEVFAVISGFHQEALEVMPAPGPGESRSGSVPPPPELPGAKQSEPPKEIVNANSGFIIAFDIEPAIKAIQSNPVGPLRPDTPTQ
ncbi:MAG TPA: hypothetical protein VK814_01700 [Acidobacteriaceae bacterium]|jgi:hypothetical protein|nr:hypothetical protein [Acidobacteriaceae bacterium]